MSWNNLFTINDISYSINWISILRDISFVIKKNQITSIIWHNGSGKSTLLKILIWTTKPSSWCITKKPWLNIWYVPQKLSFGQNIPLTVKDFLSIYNPSVKIGWLSSCSFLNITALLDIPMNWLSWGQIQKVLIHNALLWNPQLLLLDEPTAWLDVSAQKEFYSLIEHIYQEHRVSIVLVSHDMHTIYSKSDTVICLNSWFCCSWSPNDTLFSDKIKREFGEHRTPYLHTHWHMDDT